MAPPDAFILTERLRAPSVPGGYLERGDRLDRDVLGLTDETERALKFTRRAVPLTRDAYLAQIGARAPGTVGLGFELSNLVEWGILTQPEADRALKLNQVGEAYRGYQIVTVPQGRFRRLEVRDEQGNLMRPQRFVTRDKAVAFIDGLAEHDLHLQAGPV